jgi:hypothetical protein
MTMNGDRRIHGPRALRIVGGTFLMLGLAGLVVAGALAYFESSGPRSAKAEGVIVDFEYGPVIEFASANGTTSRFSSSVRSTFWHRGDHVPVAYAPDNPSDAAIDGFAGRWFLPGLAGILGGVFALVGLCIGLVGRFIISRSLGRGQAGG